MTHAASSRIPEEPHDVSRPMPHHEVPYFTIFWVLIGLTVVTVAVAMLFRFQNELVNVLLALLIASIKGLCVAMFFMHLKFEGKLIYLIFIVPLILCVLVVTALIPDVLLTAPDSSSSSMHLFNPPPMSGQH
jgi:cytochrome c oxidase subunit 4